jgi:hypothetical protein
MLIKKVNIQLLDFDVRYLKEGGGTNWIIL